jgi:hypothetical protein
MRTVGHILLALATVALIAPSFVMFGDASLPTAAGRHLLAGALANASLALVLLLLCLIPLRRGERWPLAAFVIALLVYGLPLFVIDAKHVARERLARTLAPQALGLVLILAGMVLSCRGRRAHDRN